VHCGCGRLVRGHIPLSSNPAESLGSRRFTAAEGFAWIATLTTPATPDENVELRVSSDGSVLGTVAEQSGFISCIGPPRRDIGLPAGTYLIELLVDGQVRASGTVTLT
jgi:hypothetical protein